MNRNTETERESDGAIERACESYLNGGGPSKAKLKQPKKVVHSVELAGNLVKVWL